VLIEQLLARGFRVSAFTTDSSLPLDLKQALNGSGTAFDFYICPARPHAWRPNGRRPGRIVDFFRFERTFLAETIRAASPDVVHAHWAYEFALAAIESALPHVVTCHDDPAAIVRFTRSPYRALRYCMARETFRRASCLTAVSAYIADALKRHTRVRIPVISNPLAHNVLDRGALRPRGYSSRIGMVCNGWDRRKNPKPALLAFDVLRQRRADAELHVFGHGFGTGQEAETWCIRHGVADGIRFHGHTPHSRLIEELAQLDLLLHPALEESFGVVIAEAMALGIPIVAGISSGAVPSIVGAENLATLCCAVLTDVSKPAEIARAIEQAFDQSYCERSKAGLARARALYAPGIVADQYLRLYRLVGTVPQDRTMNRRSAVPTRSSADPRRAQ
jgi:glycosyltransferase involved in cell wall biosynthesis